MELVPNENFKDTIVKDVQKIGTSCKLGLHPLYPVRFPISIIYFQIINL